MDTQFPIAFKGCDLMLLLGIDINKLDHMVSLINSTFVEVISSSFKFKNNFINFFFKKDF